MASTVLPHGIIIPEKFSRDWYNDLYHNWEELDNLLAGGTPKDGTLTIQKNGATVGTFSANQATDETVNIEVPDVNDGTLTIQQNGTDIGTFSANQSTDEAINITVPDVNNGTLTIQQNGTTVDTFTANSSSDKTVNIQCVDLNSNQTVGGNKEFTGTTTAHDVVPSATDTYNLGSSSAQWNNAYIKSLTINGVAAGDILTHNASEFVNVSTAQTIAGDKDFTGTTGTHDVIPTTTDAYDLGSSTNKWKGINGFDVTGIGHIGYTGIDQSGDTQTYTRTNPNVGHYAHYCVAPDNGWVSCREFGGSGTFQVCALGSHLEGDPIIISPPLDQYLFGSIPVRKGEYYAIISYNESASHTMRFICNNG